MEGKSVHERAWKSTTLTTRTQPGRERGIPLAGRVVRALGIEEPGRADDGRDEDEVPPPPIRD